MRLRPENTTRKIDHLGRVTIPKSLRDRMSIKTDDDLEMFTLEAEDGRTYICLAPEVEDTAKYKLAADVLDELGFNIPEILAEKAGLGGQGA